MPFLEGRLDNPFAEVLSAAKVSIALVFPVLLVIRWSLWKIPGYLSLEWHILNSYHLQPDLHLTPFGVIFSQKSMQFSPYLTELILKNDTHYSCSISYRGVR